MRVIYVGSYIPRKCGIATFTKDLTNAINVLNPYNLTEIMAINDNTSAYDYPWEVKFRINQDDLKTYIAAAEYINNSSAEVVCFQHEFGIFGGKNGEYAIPFLEQIRKPIVTTFHSVPDEPLESQKEIIRRICSLSAACVVMINNIVERLISTYGVDKKKLVVIPHGVPDIPFGATEHFKKQLKLSGKFILTSINLLSPNKGIEIAIEAVPKVVKEIPNFIYLVIGETHPVVKRKFNEEYRKELEKRVKSLKVKNQVKFINRYLTLEELISYLRAADVYITPYTDPGQVASGTLSYAVGAGKACISTPYLYAQEVVDGDRGILVPFRNSGSVAKAIVKVFSQPRFRSQVERKAYDYGRLMIWPSVALQYLDLFKLVLQKAKIYTSR
ncbi:MAG: hypothetical protein A2126_01200 [Candidatus Woykebacteria bacterium GWB1_45_5]|uniref:Glycosyl transferase family 1 n=2 Tax=Candidatus Woykeibacteriota TaxID=1817899 RepID=A0A1G1W136_9BACT|nr:MAG: hypothetical protein A2113_04265 [Candidatus Woykebacteria bacterium GWA1_44_8]OGY23089.1 MAG: hypothetical protein A2126_01200 [Candidatus Woykebacteria bacterium GWB1_45_5]